MCSMSVHYIIQKNFKHHQMHKEFILVNYNTPLHVSTLLGLREKLSVVVTLGCTIQLSENVLLTVHCAVYGGVNSL
jgi:hypothetical protein